MFAFNRLSLILSLLICISGTIKSSASDLLYSDTEQPAQFSSLLSYLRIAFYTGKACTSHQSTHTNSTGAVGKHDMCVAMQILNQSRTRRMLNGILPIDVLINKQKRQAKRSLHTNNIAWSIRCSLSTVVRHPFGTPAAFPSLPIKLFNYCAIQISVHNFRG